MILTCLDRRRDKAELVRTASQPGFWRWRAMVEATGGCADPIHLVGRSTTIDSATGEVLNPYDTDDEPNRRLLVACRNRRASRCRPAPRSTGPTPTSSSGPASPVARTSPKALAAIPGCSPP